MKNPEIAKTIMRQLGRQTFFMLGAKDFIDLGNGLRFRIRGCKKINLVRIVLAPDDTYTVSFEKVWGAKHTVVSTHEMMYFDMLHDLIQMKTGLDTRFPTFAKAQ